jgi:hypothetical protein
MKDMQGCPSHFLKFIKNIENQCKAEKGMQNDKRNQRRTELLKGCLAPHPQIWFWFWFKKWNLILVQILLAQTRNSSSKPANRRPPQHQYIFIIEIDIKLV